MLSLSTHSPLAPVHSSHDSSGILSTKMNNNCLSVLTVPPEEDLKKGIDNECNYNVVPFISGLLSYRMLIITIVNNLQKKVQILQKM
jgi:hypothetical protein